MVTGSQRQTRRALPLRWNIVGSVLTVVGTAAAVWGFLASAVPAVKTAALVLGLVTLILASLLSNLVIPWLRLRRQRDRFVDDNLVVNRTGSFPRIDEVHLVRDLLLHPSVIDEIPYVPRKELVDQIRETLLAQGRVLVSGPSVSGKTRLAIEALRGSSETADVTLVIPKNESALRRLIADDSLARLSGHIVFIPDLATVADQLSPEELNRLAFRRSRDGRLTTRNRVITTITEDEYRVLAAKSNSAARTASWFATTKIYVADNRSERRRLAARVDDQRMATSIAELGLAKYIVGAGLVVEEYEYAFREKTYAHAVITAAIDWCRTGIDSTAPKRAVLRLADSRWAAQDYGDLDETSRTAEMEWAEAEIGSSGIRMLTPLSSGWRPHPVLVEAADRRQTTDPPLTAPAHVGQLELQTFTDYRVPEETWSEVAKYPTAPTDAYHAAMRMYWDYPYSAIHMRLLERAAADGSLNAVMQLAQARFKRGEYEEAQREFGSIAGQSPAALAALGILARLDGRDPESEELFAKALSTGDPEAILTVAQERLGRVPSDPATLQLLRQAIERTGNLVLTAFLSKELAQWGNPEAGEWLRRLADLEPETAASIHLGPTVCGILAGQTLILMGEWSQAERWLRSAIENGWFDASTELSQCLTLTGRPVSGESWARRALARDESPNNLYALGLALESRGKNGEAEHWYAKSGTPIAMERLAEILIEAGRLDEAKAAIMNAIAGGSARAVTMLARVHGV